VHNAEKGAIRMSDLSPEKKLEIAMKVAKAHSSYKHPSESLLGPSYEGVCKGCQLKARIDDENVIAHFAKGYANRYVIREKIGSKANRAACNAVEEDKRDPHYFNRTSTQPLDLLFLIIDLPNCLQQLTEEERAAVLLVNEFGSCRKAGSILQWKKWKAEDRYRSAMHKMRAWFGLESL